MFNDDLFRAGRRVCAERRALIARLAEIRRLADVTKARVQAHKLQPNDATYCSVNDALEQWHKGIGELPRILRRLDELGYAEKMMNLK